jgi:hypothetical protein
LAAALAVQPRGQRHTSLSSFSYDVYATEGFPAYAKFYIDVNGDGNWTWPEDDYLTLEPYQWQEVYDDAVWGGVAFANPIETPAGTDDVSQPAWSPGTGAANRMGDTWVASSWVTVTLDLTQNTGTVLYAEHAFPLSGGTPQDGIDDILLPWYYWANGVTSGVIADPDAANTGGRGNFDFNQGGISPTDQILKIVIQVDDWVRASESYVDNVDINGITYDLEPSGEMLLKTDDGGVTWSDLTAKVQGAANLPDSFVALS